MNDKQYNIIFSKDGVGKEGTSYNIERISPSGIATYLSCPRSFYYKYILGIDVDTNNFHLLFGTAVHKVLEEFDKNTENPLRFFTEVFNLKDLHKDAHAEYNASVALGLHMCRNYIESYDLIASAYGLKRGGIQELKFREFVKNPTTGELSSVKLSGIIDLICGKTLVDYKTAGKLWEPLTEPEKMLQSKLYSLWYYTTYGELPDKFVYPILIKDYKTSDYSNWIQFVEYTPTVEDLTLMWNIIEDVVQRIKHGYFPVGNGQTYHPKYCDCHEYEKMLFTGVA
jgi:RecB family exonuclease